MLRALCSAYFLLAAVIVSTGCDNFVLAKGELEAKERFASVEKGWTVQAVESRIGKPAVIFARASDGKLVPNVQSSDAKTLSRFLGKFSEPKVLAYIDGSVLAYFGISEEGFVTARVIEIS